jgi:4-amino-4-deoxy-L-arabinose transferase-like glycosyltransferase
MIARISSRFADLETHPRYQYALLVAITLLAAGLRFYKLGEWSFWIDEIFTLGRTQAHYSSSEVIIRNIPPARNWVPLSLILIGGALNALGTSEWSARLVPAIIGIISIPVLYFPIKRLFSPGVGLIAALLLAMSPWHLYWSQNARFYTSLMLLYSLALFAFFFGLERDRPRYVLLFVVLFYLAASERLFALFIIPVVACYLLLLRILPFEKPPGLRARNLLLAALPVIAGGIIEVHSLVTTGSSRFAGDFGWFFLYRNDDPFRLLGNISYNIGVPLMSLAFFGGLYLLSQRNRAGLLMFIAAVLPVVLLLLANPFIFTKDRYVFAALPGWIILGAVAVQRILAHAKNHARLLAAGVLVLLLADAASNNLLYYRVNNGNRRDWKGAFTLAQQRGREGDVVVMWWPELGHFYLNQEIIAWVDIDPETVVRGGKRFWFVIDSETVWGNKQMKLWVEQNAELVEVKYLRTPDDFYLRVYFYDPSRNETADKSNKEALHASPDGHFDDR